MSLERVIVVVIGDAQVGKTSIVSSLVAESFSARLPAVLQPVLVPPEVTDEKVPLAIIDTSSCDADLKETVHHIKSADSVVLVVSPDVSGSFERVHTYWLPLLTQLGSTAPVVLAINKTPVQDGRHSRQFQPLLDSLVLEAVFECSAKNLNFISDVFFHAQRAVLSPLRPLIDTSTQRLRPLLVKALHRVFRHFDPDDQGILTSQALNHYQFVCFGRRLPMTSIASVRAMLRKSEPLEEEKAEEPLVRRDGVTLDGFNQIHHMFLLKHRADSVWRVLRAFGYDRDLRLPTTLFYTAPMPLPAARSGVELTPTAIEFLTSVYRRFAANPLSGLTAKEFTNAFVCVPSAEQFAQDLFSAILDAVPRNDASPTHPIVGIEGLEERVVAPTLTLVQWLTYFAMYAFRRPSQLPVLLGYLGYVCFPTSGPPTSLVQGHPALHPKAPPHNLPPRKVINCVLLGSAPASARAVAALLGDPVVAPPSASNRHQRRESNTNSPGLGPLWAGRQSYPNPPARTSGPSSRVNPSSRMSPRVSRPLSASSALSPTNELGSPELPAPRSSSQSSPSPSASSSYFSLQFPESYSLPSPLQVPAASTDRAEDSSHAAVTQFARLFPLPFAANPAVTTTATTDHQRRFVDTYCVTLAPDRAPDTTECPRKAEGTHEKKSSKVVEEVEVDYTFLVVQRVSPEISAESLALLLHTCDVVALTHDGTPESLDVMRTLLLRVPKQRMACLVVDSRPLKGQPGRTHCVSLTQRSQIPGTDYMTAHHTIGLPAEREALGARLVDVARVPGEYSLMSVTAKRKQQLLTTMSFVLGATLVGVLSYAAVRKSTRHGTRRLEIADWRETLRRGSTAAVASLAASYQLLSTSVQTTVERLLPASDDSSSASSTTDARSNAGSSNSSTTTPSSIGARLASLLPESVVNSL